MSKKFKDLGKYQKAGMKLLEQEADQALDTAARTIYSVSKNKKTVAKGIAAGFFIKEGVEQDSNILTTIGVGLGISALLGAGKMKKDFKEFDLDEFLEDIPEESTEVKTK